MPQTRGDVWAAIEANRAYTAQVELNMTQKFGEVIAKLEGMSAGMMTEQKFEQLLSQQREREERTYRRFEDDRITQLRGYPAEQREERGIRYQAMQAHGSQIQAYMSILTLALTPIISLIVTHLFK